MLSFHSDMYKWLFRYKSNVHIMQTIHTFYF